MDKDTRVTCTDCVNWDLVKERQKDYFGCRTECLNNKGDINCPCGDCNCYDPTSTRRFEHRPLFAKRETQ